MTYPVIISGLGIHFPGNVDVVSANIFNVPLNDGEVYSLYEGIS